MTVESGQSARAMAEEVLRSFEASGYGTTAPNRYAPTFAVEVTVALAHAVLLDGLTLAEYEERNA